VQGLTEFLPISSTAHLQVFTTALHWETVGAKPFVATIQFGSVIAVLIYFWKDITKILTGGVEAIRQKDWQREEWKIIVGIAVGTLPILLAGFLLKKALNDDKSTINSMTTIAIASIVMSLLLGLAEQIGNRKRNFDNLQVRDGILMGLGSNAGSGARSVPFWLYFDNWVISRTGTANSRSLFVFTGTSSPDYCHTLRIFHGGVGSD
jgi:undecaprenyl-diphosphatase